jgi:23S rRNA (adenine2030-N6)-methyltransferase
LFHPPDPGSAFDPQTDFFMLSYRHAFHAGNHADVLKHCILVSLMRYLAQKDKPYWFIDTHAGAGAYGLDAGYASRNAEHEAGILRLWGRTDLPPVLADYIGAVRALNPGGNLTLYPGSPYLASKLMREQDRMRLFELHPTDVDLLGKTFPDAGGRIIVTRGDGFAGLKSLLPPPPRRALVLIDPSYEDKADYQHVLQALDDSLERFATGIYAIWYPLLQRQEARRLTEKLARMKNVEWLNATLSVSAPSRDGFGMYGSGMFVVNPPWKLAENLRACLPYLAEKLAIEGSGSFSLSESSGASTGIPKSNEPGKPVRPRTRR